VAPGAGAYYVHRLGKDFKVGIGVLSNFGLALGYDDGWAGRYYAKRAALVGVTFAPVASYQVNEQISSEAGPTLWWLI